MRKLESGVRETLVQVVDRGIGEVVKGLQGLREGVAQMVAANQDLAWVLYQGFQPMDTLVNKVKIFGVKDYLSKLALESKLSESKLQEALREVEELEEE
ncbi:hypothetical protein ID866_8478 [Astraeus odoratus]|nr:hypothetical protein ID866_8478 [Astraeus odoratus]